MTTTAAARLGVAAASLRDVCLAALEAIGQEASAYLYPGQPPIDVAGEAPCSGIVAVYVSSIGRVPTAPDRAPGAMGGQRIARLPAAALTVLYATCVDVFGDDPDVMPPPPLLDREGARIIEAGWALMNAVQAIASGSDILADGCRPYDLGALTPLPVSGQTAGWTFTLTVTLDGYDPLA